LQAPHRIRNHPSTSHAAVESILRLEYATRRGWHHYLGPLIGCSIFGPETSAWYLRLANNCQTLITVNVPWMVRQCRPFSILRTVEWNPNSLDFTSLRRPHQVTSDTVFSTNRRYATLRLSHDGWLRLMLPAGKLAPQLTSFDASVRKYGNVCICERTLLQQTFRNEAFRLYSVHEREV
jgi:hypothetical protein